MPVDTNDREQRPHIDDGGEPSAERARRQVVRKTRNGRHGELCGDSTFARQDELETIALAQLESEARAVQATVEGVEQCPGHRVGRAELEAHLGKSGDRARQTMLTCGEGGSSGVHDGVERTGAAPHT